MRGYKADISSIATSIGNFAVGNLQALRDELKEKDDALVRIIEKCSVLEGTLRNREEELEISRAIEAQCGDHRVQVVKLRG